MKMSYNEIMKDIPKKVLDFAKKNGLENIRPHSFWNSPITRNNYNSYKVYFADYINTEKGEDFILSNNNEIRLATENEFTDILHVYF